MNILRNYIFGLSVSFQLSGALLLLIGNLTKTKENVIWKYFNVDHLFVKNMKDDATLDSNRVLAILKDIYINRIAFIYLTIGYLLVIITAESDYSIWAVAALVVLITMMLISTGYWISQIVAKYNLNNYNKIPIRDLPSETLVFEMVEELQTDHVIKNLSKETKNHVK